MSYFQNKYVSIFPVQKCCPAVTINGMFDTNNTAKISRQLDTNNSPA